MTFYTDLGKSDNLVRFLKKDDKYCIIRFNDSYEIISKSGFIYDEVSIIGKNVKCYHRTPLIKVKQNDLYGVIDSIKNKIIIPIEYDDVQITTHHFHVFYICKKDDLYEFLDNEGVKMLDYTFTEFQFIGEFSESNNYLYMITQQEEISPEEIINRRGIVELTGKLIYPFTEGLEEIKRVKNNLLVLKFEDHLELINSFGEVIDDDFEMIDMYDFYKI